jgi:hypothetical protein
MRQLSAATIRSVPASPYHYVPQKRRWWPLFAGLGAAGVSALVLLGPSQQPVEVQQRPLVHQFARSDGLSPMTARAKARAARAAHGSEVPAGVDAPAVDLFAMRLADTQAGSAVPATPAETAQAPQVRSNAAAVQAKAKRSRSSRYAARKSHRRDAFAYWGYGGGYSWGRYGYGGGRGGYF